MFPAISILISLFLFSLTSPSLAAQSDLQQPLNIEADQLLLDEQKGISSYVGHVKISQGSLLISGDKVYIHTDNEGLLSIKVNGSPAKFKQINDKQEIINAQAGHLIYERENGVLTLSKDAILIQNLNKFRSQKIIYDTKNDIVQAGQKNNTNAKERVFITIHPNTKNNKKQP